MLTLFHIDQDLLHQTTGEAATRFLPEKTVWVDLHNPTKDEEAAVERLLAIDIPTREETQEIEISSRLYVDNDALFMTIPVLARSMTCEPEAATVTFILTNNRLVTLRYADPSPFNTFLRQISRQPTLVGSGKHVLIGLLEQIVDRLADILEGATNDLDALSKEVFHANGDGKDYKSVIRRIECVNDLAGKAKDSLLNMTRLLLFMEAQVDLKKDAKARMETILRDVKSIDEHTSFLSSKIGFLLEATLGMVSIEQNNIIKIFSVAAVTFLPPTLVASVYGMNFEYLPELKWQIGYPLAIALMILSAVLPFWYFKRKKWL